MILRDISQRVWRVGYRPEPWEWADWRWAGAGGRFAGRWDALDGGLYRTVYAGDTLHACLKDARPRELTQAVSQFLWSAKDANGNDLCDGIEFLSRHGDDLVLWAVFERVGDGQISPRISNIEHVGLTRSTPEVSEVVNTLGLTMLPRAK